PLIVASLLTGVMGLSGQAVGRMFSRTLTYYLTTSLLAITTGLVIVNLVRPGSRGGINPGLADGAGAAAANPPQLSEILFAQIEALIPANPLGALVEPNFLSIIAFTIAVAIFALRV